MHIMFIENKYKTKLWEKVAYSLIKHGHSVAWIVQNHKFAPRPGNVHIIAYPQKKRITTDYNKDRFIKIEQSDRMVNYFWKKNIWYYEYYHDKIQSLIKTERPDIVIGECALFHELLTIAICRDLDVMYLNPFSCRYPSGRFSFYLYDTLVPYGGSGENLDLPFARSLLNGIIHRSLKPDYMKKSYNGLVKIINKIKNSLYMSICYYSGEKYNTPSPLVKIIRTILLYVLKIKWKNVSKRYTEMKSHNHNRFYILFPLHMQPEVSIDVWGKEYRDQAKVIKNILDNTHENIYVVIKPNPKAKYELSNELINTIRNNSRIIAVPFKKSMEELLQEIDLIITITGTIAIEALCSNIPVLTLVKTINNINNNCIYISSFSQIMNYVNKVRNKMFPQIETNDKILFLQTMTEKSYKGIISDPFNSPNVAEKTNISDISTSIMHMMGKR